MSALPACYKHLRHTHHNKGSERVVQGHIMAPSCNTLWHMPLLWCSILDDIPTPMLYLLPFPMMESDGTPSATENATQITRSQIECLEGTAIFVMIILLLA